MMRRRGWGKLGTLVLIAVVAGTGLGVGIAVLSRERDSTDPPGGQAAGGNESTATSAAQPPAAPSDTLRVRVLGAILHPAGTESGQRRRRARITVRVRAENRGQTPVTPARPALLVAGQEVHTDASADSPRTHLSDVPPGETAGVTLRFETAGDVTTTVMQDRRARMLIAGRTVSFGVKIAPPITLSDAANAAAADSADADRSDAAQPSDPDSP